jgi:hypothetical protein
MNAENIFSNPFVFSLLIVIVLNIMFIFFYRPKVGRKTFIRAFFYLYLACTTLVYFHHRQMQQDFDSKINSNLNLDLITREGSQEDIIVPQIEKVDLNFKPQLEDELI